jgi:hypothetical protein
MEVKQYGVEKDILVSNGVTGSWREVPGSQVKLYPVGYPASL